MSLLSTSSESQKVNRSFTPALVRSSDGLVSDEALTVFLWLICSVVCQMIAVFGAVTNIMNIVCFVKLGFQEPVNVSLLGK